MKTVDIKEVETRFSEYVREVRGGEGILLTDGGEVVAELWPPTPSEARASVPGLAALARRGRLTLNKTNAPDLYPPLPPIMVTGSTEEFLAEEREDRR
jgi:antitoxin (DNA-binding transcriptional repressor) of toxin-antitoxin stability system